MKQILKQTCLQTTASLVEFQLQDDSNETNESNGTNESNESNLTDLVDPQLGPPIQAPSIP